MYNYRLCRTRRCVCVCVCVCVVCAFGIFSNKWRIFQLPLNVSPDFEVVIVKASVVLHSYVRVRDGYKFEDALKMCLMDNQYVGG
jgi:hypothetical protein